MEQDVRAGASPAPPPQDMVPMCQYCGQDPAPIIPAFTEFQGIGRVAVWLCGNPLCRAVHSVQLVFMEQNRKQDSLIVTP